MKSIFIILSCLNGALCLGLGYLLGVHCRKSGLSSGGLARRPVWFGMILGTICLIWSAYHGCLMLEGDLARFRWLIWCLVPVTVILSYRYLDYLPARALGGYLTLSANFLIGGAFAHDVPGRSLYSVVCLALGIIGMVGIGIPWRYRDVLELSYRKERMGASVSVIFFLAGVVLLVMPWFARMR